MNTLIKVSIFIAILITLTKLPEMAPKKAEGSEIKTTITEIEVGYNPEVKATVVSKTIPAQPKVDVVKTSDITDGVWEWKDLIAKYFPEDQIKNALRIMSLENGSGDPTRVSKPNKNGTVDIGLFQCNSKAQGWRVDGNLEKLKDPETNVKVAHQIWSEQGNWSAWSTHKKAGL